MPGIEPLGKLFFLIFSTGSQVKTCPVRNYEPLCLRASRVRPLEDLIVRKIIRPRLWRRSKYLIPLDDSAPMSARNELVFVRIGRDDPGTARRQTINQPSIGGNSEHSNAHRTLPGRRCRSNAFLFVTRTRLTRSGLLCRLGRFRGCRSSFASS
jgi:hypothetical protein